MTRLIQVMVVTMTIIFSSCQYRTTSRAKLSPHGKLWLDTLRTAFKFADIQVLKAHNSEQPKDLITINLTNGSNLPEGEDLNVFGGNVAAKMKALLEDPKSCSLFQVYFIRKTDFGVGQKSSSQGFEYQIP